MKEQIRSTEEQAYQDGHERADYSADKHGAPVKTSEIIRMLLGPCLIGSLVGTILGSLLIRLMGFGQ